MDHPTFKRENHNRVQAVENLFHHTGKPLCTPGRILIGQGNLLKQGRKKMQRKIFFLFDDILVYGKIVVNGRWYSRQKIIHLEDIELEDVEDVEDMEDSEVCKHQWLIRTPRKSFFVSAPSQKEKQAWMAHIKDLQSTLMASRNLKPTTKFAVSWLPDQVACKCMRCLNTKFGGTSRRHHCRSCGFLVCNSCSKERVVLSHIHPTKALRVCNLCCKKINEENCRKRGDSTGKSSSEEEELAPSGDDMEEPEIGIYSPSSWLDTKNGTWGRMSTYDYPKSELQTSQ